MPKQLRVSDHALLRYLERVRGFKFDREREAIAKICGVTQNATVKSNGYLFEVRNGCVVTIMEETADKVPCRIKRDEVKGMRL